MLASGEEGIPGGTGGVGQKIRWKTRKLTKEDFTGLA